MVHPADTHQRIAHAGRNTGAEHGDDGFVLARNVVLAGQQLGREHTVHRIPIAVDALETGQGPRRRRARRLPARTRPGEASAFTAASGRWSGRSARSGR